MLIYMLRNRINGMAYIGQTVRTLRQRWSHHKCAARKGSILPIHSAIRRYGATAFDVSVLSDREKSLKELNAAEKRHILRHKTMSPRGYNVTQGQGNGLRRGGWHHTEETKKRMSQIAKGREFTVEHRKNLSLAHQGKRQPLSQATIEKIRAKKIERDSAVVFQAICQSIRKWISK
jgi:group I intron endonuclease